ncbi:hypothetical protein FACS189427_12700 [Planctomycetales bacterium]|nr:hypothetical protein FACS189427_12700 [Planctomycetales bacterium]
MMTITRSVLQVEQPVHHFLELPEEIRNIADFVLDTYHRRRGWQRENFEEKFKDVLVSTAHQSQFVVVKNDDGKLLGTQRLIGIPAGGQLAPAEDTFGVRAISPEFSKIEIGMFVLDHTISNEERKNVRNELWKPFFAEARKYDFCVAYTDAPTTRLFQTWGMKIVSSCHLNNIRWGA